MKLNNHGWGTREMIIMSSILFFLLLMVTYYIWVYYHHKDKSDYFRMEETLKVAAINYSDDVSSSNGRISSDYLIKNGYLDALYDEKGNKCDGYVIFNDGVYKSYIKCPKYTSPNY